MVTDDDDVFSRRWLLAEDELLRMLWRCKGGENPDVVVLELHARHHEEARRPRPRPHARRSRRSRGDRVPR